MEAMEKLAITKALDHAAATVPMPPNAWNLCSHTSAQLRQYELEKGTATSGIKDVLTEA